MTFNISKISLFEKILFPKSSIFVIWYWFPSIILKSIKTLFSSISTLGFIFEFIYPFELYKCLIWITASFNERELYIDFSKNVDSFIGTQFLSSLEEI